ncbi:AMP-binding protein [Oscillospiraceae bacterium OttesenSCG-928-G22]|nr:AMP-binding protein [Oscillospiraceae bacterium OttesenSCG-928-G22]
MVARNEQYEPLMEITIGDLFDETARRFPNTDALVYPHEGIRFTYAEMAKETDRIAKGLLAIGIEKGSHVAIWATNVPQWVLLMIAAAKIGAVLITVNTNYKQFELEYLLRQSDADAIFLIGGFKDSDYIAHLRGLCPELTTSEPGNLQSDALPILRNVVYLGEEGETPAGMFHWNHVVARADEVSDETYESVRRSIHPHDVVNMMYTSGTTGFPKGVMLTHHNLTNNGKCIGDSMKFTEDDRLCIPVPLFHCFGCVLGVMAAISHGTSMIMVETYSPVRVMKAVTAERCTAVHGVPTMFIAMLEHPDFDKYDFSTLRTGIMAGSPCPIQVMRRVVDEMNMRDITIVFGQTESSPGMTQSRTDDPLELRVTTVGRLLPHCEGRIVDPETGIECPPNVPGEILTRGYHVMKGYYKMPEATQNAIDKDGWLHTGDIGMVDENGYYKITGRLKDMIIRGGENIYPREIEEFLYTHPQVSDVQVVGVPDEKYGEEVLAYVVLQKGATVTEEEMVDFVKEGMSRHKAPRYVRFIDAFPMTASGKIQKFKLREMAVEDLNLRAAASIETA